MIHKRKVFTILAVLMMLFFVEITVRIAYRIKNYYFVSQTKNTKEAKSKKKAKTANTNSSIPGLDPYEEIDSKIPWLWRLKPNYSSKFVQVIESKKKLGRVLSVQYLEKQKKYITQQEIVFRVNQHGFKGPKIDEQHSKIRIIALGDSCTFGLSFIDVFCYPRTMETKLREMGRNVEVINAGVEGYGAKHILARVEEFKALQPEMVTIYIGWNDLYSPVQYPLEKKEKKFVPGFMYKNIYTYRLCVRLYQKYLKSKPTSLQNYKKIKVPDKKDLLIKKLDGHKMPVLKEIEKIVKHFQPNTKVALVTLPGLFTMSDPISKRAHKIGHLPTFTNNPYVFAKAVVQFNKSLRHLAKHYNTTLVDLERWSYKALKPRDQYFIDTVHLTNKGEQMIGVYMAKKLFPVLPKKVQKR